MHQLDYKNKNASKLKLCWENYSLLYGWLILRVVIGQFQVRK